MLLKSRGHLDMSNELENKKRKRENKNHVSGEVLFMWLKQTSAMNISLNESILMLKAQTVKTLL